MSLRLGFLWIAAGNVTFAASQWAILIVFAKFLDAQSVGLFALALAISAPIFSLSSLNLRAIHVTDVDSEYWLRTFFEFRSIASLLSIVLVFVIAKTVSNGAIAMQIIVLVAIVKVVESISDIAQGFMQKQEAYMRLSASQILKGVIAGVIVTCVAYVTRDLADSIVALILARILVFAFFDLPTTRRLSVDSKPGDSPKTSYLDFRAMRALLVLGMPIGIVLALNTLQQGIPRFALEQFMSEAVVGYFAAIAYILTAGSVVVNALGQTVLPRLATSFRTDGTAYLRLLGFSVAFSLTIGALGTVLAITIGEQLLTIIYTREYALYNSTFVIIMIGGAISFCSTALGVAITATRSFISQAVVTVPVTIVMITCCYAWVPGYGLNGAALGLAAGLLVKLMLQIYQMYCLVCSVDFFGFTLPKIAKPRGTAGLRE